jgi:hypothetical protein
MCPRQEGLLSLVELLCWLLGCLVLLLLDEERNFLCRGMVKAIFIVESGIHHAIATC